jgi:hypothetical protein
MTEATAYPIGTPGEKWGNKEKAAWLARQQIKRSYQEEVVTRLEPLKARFDIEPYGALPSDPERYPLYLLKPRQWDNRKPTVLVTGGVHGYETSGVQGAIRFGGTEAERFGEHFNILIAPCVSPWGYETINRWNPDTHDPNRSFHADSPAQEAAALMRRIAAFGLELLAHMDLHETTDTDNSEFRPAKAARDGVVNTNWNIPDGFYLVGETDNPRADFQRDIISEVKQVTHIAPPDENGKIIGEPLEQEGVINYDARGLGLCMGFTGAGYTTTTEVYPDSPRVDDENCILAQVAAVRGALSHIINNRS